ncbi:MAG: transposon-transfer assisting family protein [Lachnospiraceae bacterium]|nr:transposon-transfer assisting family protein [Lachnospiraceae bacterium]
MSFTTEEMMLMMLYSPGDRVGLMQELIRMRGELTRSERELRALTDTVLMKLSEITDKEFDQLPLYPDFELE